MLSPFQILRPQATTITSKEIVIVIFSHKRSKLKNLIIPFTNRGFEGYLTTDDVGRTPELRYTSSGEIQISNHDNRLQGEIMHGDIL